MALSELQQQQKQQNLPSKRLKKRLSHSEYEMFECSEEQSIEIPKNLSKNKTANKLEIFTNLSTSKSAKICQQLSEESR